MLAFTLLATLASSLVLTVSLFCIYSFMRFAILIREYGYGGISMWFEEVNYFIIRSFSMAPSPTSAGALPPATRRQEDFPPNQETTEDKVAADAHSPGPGAVPRAVDDIKGGDTPDPSAQPREPPPPENA